MVLTRFEGKRQKIMHGYEIFAIWSRRGGHTIFAKRIKKERKPWLKLGQNGIIPVL